MQQVFVQIGATRDGREPYLDAAKRRGFVAVLVETPAYIALRRAMGRREFDQQIAIEKPADAMAVIREIRRVSDTPRLILTGFERYSSCSHTVATHFGLSGTGPAFLPPSKHEQRIALYRSAPRVGQPAFCLVPQKPGAEWAASLSYPLVLKPVDGGGGLGVVLVDDPAQLQNAVGHVKRLRNYDNSPFVGLMVEQYIEGSESSVQGLMCAGQCYFLSYCSKLIALELLPENPGLTGFREVAHIAVGPKKIPKSISRFAEQSIRAVGYRDGPFHIDFRETLAGLFFLEMGFRLSGAAVADLTRAVSGCDWGEAAFSWMMGEGRPPLCSGDREESIANVLAFSEEQIEAARQAGEPFRMVIEQLSSVRSAVSEEQALLLEADLSRHTGPIARIQICGRDSIAVRNLAVTLSNLNPMLRSINYEQQMESSRISL